MPDGQATKSPSGASGLSIMGIMPPITIAGDIVAAAALALQIGRFLHMRLVRDAVFGEPPCRPAALRSAVADFFAQRMPAAQAFISDVVMVRQDRWLEAFQSHWIAAEFAEQRGAHLLLLGRLLLFHGSPIHWHYTNIHRPAG